MAKKKTVTEEVQTEEVQVVEEKKSLVTYLGDGPLSGEYRFAEFAGSIAAASKEEAIAKAEELAVKHPDLLVK
jgi:hypothetical protein